MSFLRVAVLSLAVVSTSVCHAAVEGEKKPATAQPATEEVYSSIVTVAAPATIEAPAPNTGVAMGEPKYKKQDASFKPFHSVAIGVKAGTTGVGFDIATPLNRHLNLRGGAAFFGYSASIVTDDGYQVNGDLKFKNVSAMLDYYPMGGSFRISPGVIVYNGNGLDATATVAAGSTFSLGDVDYISATDKPVNGTMDLKFGNKVAPALTVGWGNMIPRHLGQHWSVPFEIGFEYISDPKITLNLAGYACPTNPAPVGACTSTNLLYAQNLATDPTAQGNTRKEESDLNSDISPLKVYPIITIGLAYKF